MGYPVSELGHLTVKPFIFPFVLRVMLLFREFRGAKEAEKLTSKVDSLAEQFLRSTGASRLNQHPMSDLSHIVCELLPSSPTLC